MTLEQIKLKIGERVDDDNAVAYADRYEGIFISAMIDMIKSVDKNGTALFSPTEYPELSGPFNKSITFTDGFSQILYDDINAIFIRDIYSNLITVAIAKRINFQPRTIQELMFIRSNPHLEPAKGEGYWAKKSASVFILISPKEKIDTETPFSLDIVKNPSSGTWVGKDLEDDLHYGRSFIEASIKRSAEILKSEIGLE